MVHGAQVSFQPWASYHIDQDSQDLVCETLLLTRGRPGSYYLELSKRYPPGDRWYNYLPIPDTPRVPTCLLLADGRVYRTIGCIFTILGTTSEMSILVLSL